MSLSWFHFQLYSIVLRISRAFRLLVRFQVSSSSTKTARTVSRQYFLFTYYIVANLIVAPDKPSVSRTAVSSFPQQKNGNMSSLQSYFVECMQSSLKYPVLPFGKKNVFVAFLSHFSTQSVLNFSMVALFSRSRCPFRVFSFQGLPSAGDLIPTPSE